MAHVEFVAKPLPHYELPAEVPVLPGEIYRTRYQNLDSVRKRAGYDCFLIYGDREHAGNLAWLTGFAPRFEEALWIQGPSERPVLIVGNTDDSWSICVPTQWNEHAAKPSAASLIVRPDRLSVAPADSLPNPERQRIIGRVRQVVYLGRVLKYELEALGQTVYARTSADASGFVPAPGQEVAAEWRTEHGIIVLEPN